LLFERAQREYKLLEDGVVFKADAFEKVIRNLSFAAQRFDSLSHPLFVFFTLMPVCVKTLRLLTIEGDADDVAWSVDLLKRFSGEEGYYQLITAAMSADALILGQRFIRMSDEASDSIIMSGRQCVQLLHELQVLFKDGAIFLEVASGTCTQLVLRGIQKVGIVDYLGRDKKAKVIGIGWPDPGSLQFQKPREKAKDIFLIFKAFVDSNFPGFEAANAYMAFDLQVKLGWSDREKLCHAVAKQHGHDSKVLWRELAGTDSTHAHSMMSIAFWHFSESSALPGMEKSASAWMRCLLGMTMAQLASRSTAVAVVRDVLATAAGTCNVERYLGRVSLVEGKHRAHKLGAQLLTDCVKLQSQDLQGRLLSPMDPTKLLVANASESRSRGVAWKASSYCLRAQNVYREFFGEKRIPSRNLESCADSDHRSQKPRIGHLRTKSADTMDARLRHHTESVDAAVAAHALGGTSVDSKCKQLAAFVANPAEFTAATVVASCVGQPSSKCVAGGETSAREQEGANCEKDERNNKKKDEKDKKLKKEGKSDKKHKDEKHKDKKHKDEKHKDGKKEKKIKDGEKHKDEKHKDEKHKDKKHKDEKHKDEKHHHNGKYKKEKKIKDGKLDERKDEEHKLGQKKGGGDKNNKRERQAHDDDEICRDSPADEHRRSNDQCSLEKAVVALGCSFAAGPYKAL